ncbi:hypothetical protein B7C51_24830 (plasmid) [Paenibacillus larvae subsp. pulvifaciens]|uniref:Uncharacterized protein n=1 Tax=Paenibacillus larvae subsp. pulvifaciens TaxID=1477 RepID=A0A1V0UZP1_9BACL|nr:hypothetical protein [Paenibacillus larvae]ARF70702.1 hypothetical protein B7C51_24830 [Paenibacillus larvae subsp. pulvifaciens]
MKAYKVTKENMMGFRIEEEYYLNKQNARIRFDQHIKEYRKSKYLAKKGDHLEYQSRPIEINKNPKNFGETERILIEASVALWRKTNYEYDEWDMRELELMKLS